MLECYQEDGGIVVETEETGMCTECKEWSSINFFVECGEITDARSDCCSAKPDFFHFTDSTKDRILEAAEELLCSEK